MRLDLIQIAPIPQHVPSPVCLSCDVCCRFPEVDSFLRPYFTAQEIAEAISRGIDADAFPDRQGSQIRVVPNPAGEGYVCSAFDPATSHCRIYEKRPLDCQIYPLAVMWSADGTEVVLGWDRKCPFLGQARGERQGARG
jgi:Fe-S-cluster containining protein